MDAARYLSGPLSGCRNTQGSRHTTRTQASDSGSDEGDTSWRADCFERDRAATPLEAAEIRSRDCDAGDVQRCSSSAFAEAWRSPADRHGKLLLVRPLYDVSERGLGCDLADGWQIKVGVIDGKELVMHAVVPLRT
jgi:hypothetical protein